MLIPSNSGPVRYGVAAVTSSRQVPAGSAYPQGVSSPRC
jgi:hypothetical protein